MLYVDYHWDLTPTAMIPDAELNTDRLHWKTGDFWKVVDINENRKALVKVDSLTAMVTEHATEIKENNNKLYQFAVYTRSDEFVEVINWLRRNNIRAEVHLNRTRFWIPYGPELLEFLLTWGSVCPRVDDETDHVLGTKD
jgi:hypothetical protein